MKTNHKTLKNKIAELKAVALFMSISSATTPAFAQADRSGDGGHGMEAQFSNIASNIYTWLQFAKQNKTLKEKIQMTESEADLVLRRFDQLTLPGHIQFVTRDLTVTDHATGTQSSPRVCTPEGELIVCNQKMWVTQNMT